MSDKAAPVTAVLADISSVLSTMKSEMAGFQGSSKALIAVLDELGKIHAFVGSTYSLHLSHSKYNNGGLL